jgi:3-oxoacyl-[acyl-carrier protein] reductase
VAVVTGASRGIGRAAALRLVQLSYAVVINYVHDQQTAEGLVEAILDDRGSAVAIRADVADELDVERLFAAAVEAFGRVDAVVHAVRGDLALSPVAEIALDDLDRMLRTTSRAAFLVNREAVRHVRNGGAIINLTGSLSASTSRNYRAYATATAAVQSLTRMLALELQEREITVNALSLEVEQPCAPDRIADFIAYLLSEAGHGVSGQVIHLDYAREGPTD